MKKSLFALFLGVMYCFLLQSCNKKDPNPELIDPIYLDLKSELDISTKQEIDLQKQVEKDALLFKNTQPQTGMHNVNRNKLSTSENLLNVIQQQKKFFQIKMEQRKIYVHERYLESLKSGGRPWPDEKEIADYKIRMKLQRAKFDNDVKNVPRGTSDKRDEKEPKKESKEAAPAPAKH